MPDSAPPPSGAAPQNPNAASQRYARQTRFAPIGETGQAKLTTSSVAVVGCGALGTVAADILVRAGVGQVRLIDRDVVEWSNLQRQSLFCEQDASLGVAKADAAQQRLRQINSGVDVQANVADVTASNVTRLLSGVNLVIDATDNFTVRFLLNDWSLRNKTPWVHGGCVGANGQVRLFDGLGQPCFRCLVPVPPQADAIETCDTAGVVGSATHLIASFQTMEAIKWLTGNRESVRKKILSIDLWHNRIRELNLPPTLSQGCQACDKGNLEYLDGTAGVVDDGATVLCGRNAVQLAATSDRPVDLSRLADQWNQFATVSQTPFFVRLSSTSEDSMIPPSMTLTIFRDGRVVVDGTEDPSVARTLRDRTLGS